MKAWWTMTRMTILRTTSLTKILDGWVLKNIFSGKPLALKNLVYVEIVTFY